MSNAGVLEKRDVSGAAGLTTLEVLESLVHPVDAEWYQSQERHALARISERDPDDWPAPACALTLDCSVWTEDADFFGTVIAHLDHQSGKAVLGTYRSQHP